MNRGYSVAGEEECTKSWCEGKVAESRDVIIGEVYAVLVLKVVCQYIIRVRVMEVCVVA